MIYIIITMLFITILALIHMRGIKRLEQLKLEWTKIR